MFAKAVRASVRAAASPRQLVAFLSEGGALARDGSHQHLLLDLLPFLGELLRLGDQSGDPGTERVSLE